MAEKGKHIDHIIRDKMSRLNPQFDATSWDQLSDRLAQSEVAEDAVLRDRMQNLKPDYAAASWMELSEKLEVSELQLDEVLRSKLRKIKPAFNESSWAILSTRIEQQNRRAQTILSYKFSELSLLLLLLFVFLQFGPLGPASNPQYDSNIPETLPQHLIDPAPQVEDEITPLHTPVNAEASEVPIAATLEEQEPKDKANAATVNEDANLTTVKLEDKLVFSLDGSFVEQNIRAIQKQVDAPDRLPSIEVESLDQKSWSLIEDESVAEKASNTSREISAAIETLAAIDWMSPESNYPTEDLDVLTLLKPVERKTAFRFGFAGSPDYNRVITPAIDIPGRDTAIGLDRYSLGYSGGFSFGIERGRWEIELGALYAVRSYENLPIIALAGNIRDGYQGVSLKKNELNMLNVPLHFRYNFYVHDKWRVYGLTGGSISTILQANYYVVNEAAFNLSFSVRPSIDGARSSLTDELLNTERPEGILEGGRFWNNTSIRLDVGFGLERYMSHRWSIFAQPTYQHAVFSPFRGFGPYRDRIHSMSILMGMKVKL